MYSQRESASDMVVAVVAVAPCVLVQVGGPAPELHVQLGNSLSQPHILSRVTCYASCVMFDVPRGHDVTRYARNNAFTRHKLI